MLCLFVLPGQCSGLGVSVNGFVCEGVGGARKETADLQHKTVYKLKV